MKAWAYDREALGPPPPGVELVAEPGPDVEFVVPRWEDMPALDEMPALRVVQLLSAGVDWIADRVPPGVTLCSARGARDRAMAEWVMAAILADAKGVRECAEQQARRHWELVGPVDPVARAPSDADRLAIERGEHRRERPADRPEAEDEHA